MITNFKQLKTKKSQAKMCAFTIEDKTGTIEAVVFPNEYKKIADSLNEDAVLIFNGDCKEETVFNSGDEEKRELKFYVSSIERAEPDYRKLSIEVNGMDEWLEVLKDLDVYKASDGYELYVFDKFLGEFRHTDFFVSPDIQYNKRDWRIKPMDAKVG